jgi:5'(3')-deoxyribonucleotidase
MRRSGSTIAVDLDDVLFDFIGNFFEWHNQRYGTTLAEQDMVTDVLWDAWGGTKADARTRVSQFWRELDHLAVQPMPGAVEVLHALTKSHRLVIISARDPVESPLTSAWIEKYFNGVFADVRLGIANPMAGSQPPTKAAICREVGATTLIDDQLVHVEECVRLGIRVLLFGKRSWNRSDGLPRSVVRVNDWDAVPEALSG